MAVVLVIGSGGREHAIAFRLREEGHAVHVAPGDPGHEAHATIHRDVAAGDATAIVELARTISADLVVVGPEQPLVDGLADRLREAGIATFGPSAAAAVLEGSKAEAKAFMVEYGIPTARHVTVHDVAAGLAAVRTFDEPPVVKADGLAAGKGVTVADTFAEAEAALRECLESERFGAAGRTVVLEERLRGREVSVFAITDGTHVAMLPAAQDHKRIGDGDTGPNTGGMGAYSPAPIYTDPVHRHTMDRIVRPTLAGLRAQGRPFVGVLFVGLMIDDDGEPYVVEYNCRFGDPEAQPLLFGLDVPLYPVLAAAANGTLGEDRRLPGKPAATIVLASAGYPLSSRSGDAIAGLDRAAEIPDTQVFHAGTRRDPHGGWETAGGRVLGVCARGDTLEAALRRAYAAADCIHFEGRQMRRDIGWAVRDRAPLRVV
jgi:phosphoribosylamine--glycine ligase